MIYLLRHGVMEGAGKKRYLVFSFRQDYVAMNMIDNRQESLCVAAMNPVPEHPLRGLGLA